jgi:ankyrin repeat protein
MKLRLLLGRVAVAALLSMQPQHQHVEAGGIAAGRGTQQGLISAVRANDVSSARFEIRAMMVKHGSGGGGGGGSGSSSNGGGSATVPPLSGATAGFLLCEAAYRGRDKMVRLLLKNGADVRYVDVSAKGGRRTPLHYAVAGYDETNRYEHGKPMGRTVSGRAVATAPELRYGATVKVLVNAEAPLGDPDEEGMTALHAAARARFVRGVELMSAAASSRVVDQRTAGGPGADPRHANSTALLLVAAGLRRSLMLLATTALKPIEPDAHDAFHAWVGGWPPMLQPLVANGSSGATLGGVQRRQLAPTLSGWACALARPLLRASAAVGAVDAAGWSPLSYSADFGDAALSALLLSYADGQAVAGGRAAMLRHVTPAGMTPLSLAQRSHSHDLALLRLLVTPQGSTAADDDAQLTACTDDPQSGQCKSTQTAAASGSSGEPASEHVVDDDMPVESWQGAAMIGGGDCTIDRVPMDVALANTSHFWREHVHARRPVLLTNASELRSWVCGHVLVMFMIGGHAR